MLKTIQISQITDRESTQTRAALNNDAVTEYAVAMLDGVKFPPVIVFQENDQIWVADGFHRVAAVIEAGLKDILADVRPGNRLDAIKYGLGANKTHGVRRTNADKRRAVEIALREFSHLTDRAVAGLCGVSHPFVAELRYNMKTLGVLVTVTNTNEENNAENSCSVGNVTKTNERETLADAEKRTGIDGRSYLATKLNRDIPPLQVRKTFPPPPPPLPRLVAMVTGPSPPRSQSPPPQFEPEPAPKSQTIKDKVGREVPEKIIELWNRALCDTRPLLTDLSRIKSALTDAVKNNDLVYAEVNYQAILAHLENAYVQLQVTIPYAVCPSCQGKLLKTCVLCKGRGYISKHLWDAGVPDSLKRLIIK